VEFLGSIVLWPYMQPACWCCCYVGPVLIVDQLCICWFIIQKRTQCL